jgi:flagellar hook-basal body complex protein FliE
MLPPVDTSSVMALRARILAQSDQLGGLARTTAPASVTAGVTAPSSVTGSGGAPFEAAMGDALKAVNELQADSGAKAAAYERGDSQDLAAVMLARQKASIAFEATLQVRNKLLGAYKDVMSMPL